MDLRVINPYNFIPFGEKTDDIKVTREAAYRNGESLKSGWLDVRLIPTTPLIIPDGAHPVYIDTDSHKKINDPSEQEKKKAHKQYGFMNRQIEGGDLEYYIPGSSVRGMLRSVYEAATNSCVPFLLADAKKPISQRVPLYAALKQRGLLSFEYDESKRAKVWKLYSVNAEIEPVSIREIKGTDRNGKPTSTYDLYDRNGTKITVPTGKYIEGKGVVQYNIPVDIKKEYHLAYLSKKEVVHTWKDGDDEPYRLLKSVLCRDNVKGNQLNRNEKPAEDLKKALEHAKENGGTVPVYYFIVIRKHEGYEEKLVYLSNSSIGRIAQKRRWVDIMAEHGPCTGEKLCPACLLFGALGTEHGLKSHVRITDALPEHEIRLENKTLDVLGEPRTSAFEFYLKDPEGASYWNFDFYGITEKDINGVEHTKYYDMEKASPRGRKMYWHGKPVSSGKQTKLTATMASVEGVNFDFRVYFDEITEAQLQDLIWTITLGDNQEKSPYQHKLGHAKPLGYGSVKLVITGGKLRKVSVNEDGVYVSTESIEVNEKPGGGIDLNRKYVKDLLRMSDTNATQGVPVQYPVGPDGKIYSWFSENRIRASEVTRLPLPSAEDISIKSNEKKERFSPKGKDFKNRPASFKPGERTNGKVSGFTDSGSGMFVTMDNGRKSFVFYKNMYKRIGYGEINQYFTEGMTVSLEYRGKDAEGREQWFVVE